MAFNRLSFLLCVDLISPNPEQPEIRGEYQHWIPPTIPSGVTTLQSTGWYRWTPNGLERVGYTGGEDFRVCSLFYNSECAHFLGVPFDCRNRSVQEDMESEGLGWRRVMFNYSQRSPFEPPISVMGFDSTYHVLAARGSPSWMPELIPETYTNNVGHGGSTGIAGNLALLIAFAAFSNPTGPNNNPINSWNVNSVLSTINNCFRPPTWRPRMSSISRQHASGVVVSIKVDPNSAYPETELLRVERGSYGPLIGA